jgi:hypothetical protein
MDVADSAGGGASRGSALDHEGTNLSYETGSSGNSNSGSGLGSRMSAPAGLPTYSTPSLVSDATSAFTFHKFGVPYKCFYLFTGH